MVVADPRYFRPTEVETLLGDPTKATLRARASVLRAADNVDRGRLHLRDEG